MFNERNADTIIAFNRRIFLSFFFTLFNTASSAAPSDSTVSEDAGVDCCDYVIGRQSNALPFRLDLIHIG